MTLHTFFQICAPPFYFFDELKKFRLWLQISEFESEQLTARCGGKGCENCYGFSFGEKMIRSPNGKGTFYLPALLQHIGEKRNYASFGCLPELCSSVMDLPVDTEAAEAWPPPRPSTTLARSIHLIRQESLAQCAVFRGHESSCWMPTVVASKIPHQNSRG